MRVTTLAIVAGPCVAVTVYFALPAQYLSGDGIETALSPSARSILAMGSWMALWWISEAVPVAVTALLPIAVFPLLGLNSLGDLGAAYAHPLIFLFFGGFLLAIAIEKWRLHAWIAAWVVRCAAGDLRRLIAGFMLVSAFASMWLSNTATTIMMLPIGVSMVAQIERSATPAAAEDFARCLFLGIAYAASIGGTATLIGSPPNLFVASFLQEQFDVALDFRTWMLAAMPVSVVMLPLTWLALTRWIAPVDGPHSLPVAETSAERWSDLPRASRRVAAVFAITVSAWLVRSTLTAIELAGARPFAALTDTGVVMLAALALFIIPAGDGRDRLLVWGDVEKLPFGTLILFGGGLALAATVTATGADGFIGAQLAGLQGIPPWLVVATVVTVVVFLTEMTSNTATTTTLVPILAAAAVTLGLEPVGLIVVTALAASCAFMMPVATPPNAIIFSTGRITVAAMVRAGLVINVLAILVITLTAQLWIPTVALSAAGP